MRGMRDSDRALESGSADPDDQQPGVIVYDRARVLRDGELLAGLRGVGQGEVHPQLAAEVATQRPRRDDQEPRPLWTPRGNGPPGCP
eukprot:8883576-Heterocapsa_arctica.AAC.1